MPTISFLKGTQRIRLTTARNWELAIQFGDLEADRMVDIDRGDGPVSMRAGDVPELRDLFPHVRETAPPPSPAATQIPSPPRETLEPAPLSRDPERDGPGASGPRSMADGPLPKTEPGRAPGPRLPPLVLGAFALLGLLVVGAAVMTLNSAPRPLAPPAEIVPTSPDAANAASPGPPVTDKPLPAPQIAANADADADATGPARPPATEGESPGSVSAPPPEAVTAPPSAPASSDLGSAERAAMARALSFFAEWSAPDDSDGRKVRGYFASTVNFYGSVVDIDNVMLQNAQFCRRWPVRTYTVRPSATSVTCDGAGACAVRGIVDWEAANPAKGRHSTGVAQFMFGFRDGLIDVESGKVLSRTTTP